MESIITPQQLWFNSIIKHISKDYNIPYNELEKYYKENKNIINKTSICMATKQDGNQCTRKSKIGSLYCGKHSDKKSIPFAEPVIELNVFYLKDDIYFVDDYGIVYKNHMENKYKIVGKKKHNSIQFI